MDDFRKKQWEPIGPGGFRCNCCNDYHGKRKKKLNKLARSRLKKETEKEMDKE